MLPELTELTELIRRVAGEELVPRFAIVKRELKADGSVVTVADRVMQERLRQALAERWPEFRFLGEEMSSAEQSTLIREPGAGLWILDPLDGTNNFATGIPFFAVSLGLLVDAEIVLGVVYDPTRDEAFSACKQAGAWCNDERLEKPRHSLPLKQAIAAVDFKRLSRKLAARLASDPPYSSQRSLGSVALDWCWVAAGRFHVYLHGRQKPWDYVAGELILSEAGGQACTLDGDPVFRLTNEPRSVIAALDKRLFEEWQAWIQGC